MAGIISYISDGKNVQDGSSSGRMVSSRNNYTGVPSVDSKNGSTYFDITGGKSIVEDMRKPTTNPKIQIADIAKNHSKNAQPIIDSSSGHTFSTDTYYPFKQHKGSSVSSIIDKLNDTVNIMDRYTTHQSLFNSLCVKKYNRFKMKNYNEVLQRGFPHIFFVRPDCNIIQPGTNCDIVTDNAHHDLYQYARVANPEILKELTLNCKDRDNDFMMSLSNRAISFSSNDEGIEAGEYGTTYTGYKISYGKNDIKSKTAGSFQIQISDDRNFYIYQIIRCWVEYISGVYRGELIPKKENIVNKILDYASAVYYFILAEDGETILFWSKYYGVYPTNIPATQYSWSAGNTVHTPDLAVDFNYSFKRDFSPYIIAEFNHNARIKGATQYESTFDPYLNTVGKTWVGTPFIEAINNSSLGGSPYELKLRFKKVALAG